MSSLELAMIGNCNIAALIDQRARIVWGCFPRLDGDPMFCALLLDHGEAEAGYFDIELKGLVRTEQRYRRNTPIVETILHAEDGSALQITDFAPRFKQFGRTFRPMMIAREIKPLAGLPKIRIRLRPLANYGAEVPERTQGSNHIRYVGHGLTLRLTTDAPLSYIVQETSFTLDGPLHFLLGPDETVAQSVAHVCRDFFEQTENYWFEWCRYLALPFEWQEAVIRAAITLKLANFEDSGAVVAAITTSIPEAPNTERNWDYRFCWLRDSYFVVHALNRLGVTRSMEGYLRFIVDVADVTDVEDLQPVFGITQETNLTETVAEALPGYRGMGPVRIGNGAYTQIQNDGYGHVVLAATQSFFDHRLSSPGDESLFRRLETLGHKALSKWCEPDAGLWEFRNRQHVHTFSALMCWAACDRLARIARRLSLGERQRFWRQEAEKIRSAILEQAWCDKRNSFVGVLGGGELDASLLLMGDLGFVRFSDPRFIGTVETLEKELRRGNYLFRYAAEDDFGRPETSFNVCTFWFIDALAGIGRREKARELFETMLAARNHVGLLSEDVDPATGELWGNYPQTYSMVGLINSAMRLSKTWEEAF